MHHASDCGSIRLLVRSGQDQDPSDETIAALGRKAVDSYFAAQSIEFVHILGFYRRSVWSLSVIDLSNNIAVGAWADG